MNLRKLAEQQPCYLREDWRLVLGYEGYYEVSNQGRVRSKGRTVSMNYGSRKRTYEAKLMGAYVASSGYLCVALCKGGRKKIFSIHRLVASAFVGGSGAHVRHLNGNRMDCRADNLAWGSQADNEADKRAHGRLLFGERHPMAALDTSKVLDIRMRYAAGATQTSIAVTGPSP